MDPRLVNIERQLAHLKNVVVNLDIGCEWPSSLLASVLFQARYAQKVFPAAVIHFQPTDCTLSIFKSGQVMATGAASEHRAYISALMLCDRVNQIYPHKCARIASFKVVNRVAHVRLGINLDMEKLARWFKWSGLYDPKSFPGMKIQMIDLGVTFVIFRSQCKVNIAGIRHRSYLPFIAQRLLMLHNFEANGTDVPMQVTHSTSSAS